MVDITVRFVRFVHSSGVSGAFTCRNKRLASGTAAEECGGAGIIGQFHEGERSNDPSDNGRQPCRTLGGELTLIRIQ